MFDTFTSFLQWTLSLNTKGIRPARCGIYVFLLMHWWSWTSLVLETCFVFWFVWKVLYLTVALTHWSVGLLCHKNTKYLVCKAGHSDTVPWYLVPGTVRPRDCKNLYDRLSFGFILSLPLLDRSTLFASPSIRQSVSRQPSAYEVSAREHDSLVCAFYCTVFAWSGPIRRATIATRRSRGILWKLSA